MCVICASARGQRQPTEQEIRKMFAKNPHGAGLMWIEGKHVEIAKGFMKVEDLLTEIKSHHFTEADPVVYHFRISTQGGVNKEMTQPFARPHGFNYEDTKKLRCRTDYGIAHNGIIPMTDDPTDKEYSDTAHWITEYMWCVINGIEDLNNPYRLRVVKEMIGASRLAILDKTGKITMVGSFVNCNGLTCSNSYWITQTEDKPKANYNYKTYKSNYPSWKRQLIESARKPEERTRTGALNFV